MSDIHILETNLDLKQNLNIYTTCKQLDTLHLKLNIYDDGLEATLTNYNVRLKAMKADKVPLIQETGITIVGNIVTIIGDEQLTSASGNTLVELQFINKTTGEKKSTFNLVLKVIATTLEVNRTISKSTYTLLQELENKLDQAGDFFENIDKAIESNTNLIATNATANTTKTNLDGSISTANTTKTALDTLNTNAIASKKALDTSITNADNSKVSLDTSKTNADTSKVALDTSINNANTFVENHGNIIDLDNRVNQNTTQLSESVQQNYYNEKRSSVPYNYTGAMFTFIDDDCPTRFLTNLKPTFDVKGVKATLGCITSYVDTTGYMTKQNLLDLQNEGYEIVSHTKTHSGNTFKASQYDLSSIADSDFEEEFKDSQDWLINNGFKGFETVVYPWGNFGSQASRIKKIARKYYKNGVNAVGTYNSSPNDNMYLDRVFLDKTTDIATIKATIDNAIINNAWLIIGTHSADVSHIDGDYLGQVIDYISSKNSPILTFSEALKYKGNALSIGEYTDTTKRFFIGNSGGLIFDNLAVNILDGLAPDNGYSIDSLLTVFPINKITIYKVRGGASYDNVTNEGGLVTVYNFGNGSLLNFETYISFATNRMFIRKWNDSSNTWGTWDEFIKASNTTFPNLQIVKGTFTGTMDQSITSYTKYKETVMHVPSTLDTYLGVGGVMKVYRGETYYSYAEFRPVNANAIHMRRWVEGSSSWGAWNQI